MIKHSSTLLHMINHSRTLLHIIKHSSTPLHMTVTVTVTSATSLLCSARRRAVRSMTGTRLHRQSTMFTHRPCTTLFVSSPTPSRTESDTFDQETSSCMKFSFDKKVSKNEVRVVRRTFFYSKSCAMFCRSLDHQNCH